MLPVPVSQNCIIAPSAHCCPFPEQLWNIVGPLLLPLLAPLLLLPKPPLLPLPPGPTLVPQALEQELCSHELMLTMHCWQLAVTLLEQVW